jgi:hypothetical protein
MRNSVEVIAVIYTGLTEFKLFASIAARIEGTAEGAGFSVV